MKDLVQQLVRFGADDRGATAIEYGLIAAMIALGAIAAMTALGGNVGGLFNFVSNKGATAMDNAAAI